MLFNHILRKSTRCIVITHDLLQNRQVYYLPIARTNYGVFSIRTKGPRIWNATDETIKAAFSLSNFKKNLTKIELFGELLEKNLSHRFLTFSVNSCFQPLLKWSIVSANSFSVDRDVKPLV